MTTKAEAIAAAADDFVAGVEIVDALPLEQAVDRCWHPGCPYTRDELRARIQADREQRGLTSTGHGDASPVVSVTGHTAVVSHRDTATARGA